MKNQPNKAPDEATLTIWMDGGLDGDELARIDAWAKDHPELLAERDAVRAMSASIKANVPASIEPPYADFFNQRILHHIEDGVPAVSADEKAGDWFSPGRKWARWLAFPVMAGAMAVCFYLGTRIGDGQDQSAQQPALVAASVPTVYTPDGDVSADMFSSEDADATIIVLEGLEDIPDDFEIVSVSNRGRSSQHGAVMVSTKMVF